MNYAYVLKQMSLLLFTLAAAMLAAPLGARLLAPETATAEAEQAFLIAVAAAAGFGFLLRLPARGRSEFLGRREALLLVAMTWLIGPLFAAVPFFVWARLADVAADHPFRYPAACYFEAMSGLTTTGATVVSDIEALPAPLLLWRSLTHWMGGLGIVVLFVAVFPTLGVGGKRLFQVESSTTSPSGVRPRIRETARVLWTLYLLMTVAGVIGFRLCGLGLFDAINHSFSAVATGGFSTRNASFAAFENPAAEWVAVFFMLIAGVNFGLYYLLIVRRFRRVREDAELRTYLGLIAGVCVLVALGFLLAGPGGDGFDADATWRERIRAAVFQAVSVQTSTGFVSADFEAWPPLAKTALLAIMFVGGSTGSTAGGIKVLRVLTVAKLIVADFERAFRPSVVRPVRLGGRSRGLEPEIIRGTLVYVLTALTLFAAGAAALIVLEQGSPHMDPMTAISASAASLNNIGPGFGAVGATDNFGRLSSPALIVLCVLMALGRLEIFAIAVLFLPAFWRSP